MAQHLFKDVIVQLSSIPQPQSRSAMGGSCCCFPLVELDEELQHAHQTTVMDRQRRERERKRLEDEQQTELRPQSSTRAVITGGTLGNFTPVPRRKPIRVVIHSYNPEEVTSKEAAVGVVVNLPASIEQLFVLSEKRFGRKGSRIVMHGNVLVEELDVLRDMDKIYIY